MESRADDRLKARYAAMSEVLGYDIHQFYMENSKQQGYKRLNRAIKAPIIHRMRELTHSLGMRFHVSDAFCRECNDACNCCGVPPEWGVSQTGNIGNAIIIAREKGFVTFSDVMESINKYFGWGPAATTPAATRPAPFCTTPRWPNGCAPTGTTPRRAPARPEPTEASLCRMGRMRTGMSFTDTR